MTNREFVRTALLRLDKAEGIMFQYWAVLAVVYALLAIADAIGVDRSPD